MLREEGRNTSEGLFRWRFFSFLIFAIIQYELNNTEYVTSGE